MKPVSFMEVYATDYMKNKRARIILKKGNKHMPLRTEDIAIFYTENKIIYAIDRLHNKFICDYNLFELADMLDDRIFFRANRQYIININFIRSFQPVQRVKTQIELTIGESTFLIIVSQLTTVQFKKWIAET